MDSSANELGATTGDPPESSISRVEPTDIEAQHYGSNVEVWVPESADELQDILRQSAAGATTLIPSGLGSQAYLGHPPPGDCRVVSLRRLGSILRYEPADFTVGVQAGTSLSTLRAELEANGQEIAVDVSPDPEGSIGGAVASARSGPRSGSLGSYRNYIIGVSGMRGDGTVYRAGGMVVKNVAGYDVGKLLAGSLGTLGAIVELNFKLRPLPEMRSAEWRSFGSRESAWDFAMAFYRAGLEPSVLHVFDPGSARILEGVDGARNNEAWTVFWSFEGNRQAVGFQRRSGEKFASAFPEAGVHRIDPMPSKESPVSTVLERLSACGQPDDPSRKDLFIVRVSALATTVCEIQEQMLDLARDTQVDLEDSVVDVSSGLAHLRLRGEDRAAKEFLDTVGAKLTQFHARGRLLFASPELREHANFLLITDPNRELARRIQRVFDPEGIFHRDRIHGRN